MADRDNSKYFYLRLKEDFFDSDELVYLESLPDGILYSNILLKLYLRSLKTDGRLMLRDRIPYNPLMLANILRQPVGVVEKAIKTLNEIGLIEILDNGAIYMVDIQNFIGKSSTEADRKRDYRQRIESEKALISENGDKCPDKSPTNVGTMSTISRSRTKSKDLDLEQEQQTKESKGTKDEVVVVDNPFTFWEKNMGLMTEYISQCIQMLVKDYGELVVIEGMQIALKQGKRSIAYVEGCCKNIHSGNVKPEKKELLF